MFELPKNRVRVISDFTGGGFGAKYGIGNFGLLAIHLSRKAGAPVRLMLDRREEHVSAGNRPGSLQRLKIGARRDGTLTAIPLESYGTGGVAGGAGIGFAHAMLYPCANVRADQYDVFTNAGPCAAFRAPGQVQGIFALEQSIDELADRLELDPLALRDSIDTTGQTTAKARARSGGSAPRSSVGRRAGQPARSRTGQARRRRRAVALAVGDPPADRLRGADRRRRLGRGVHRGTGRRHRDAHDPGAGRGRGVRAPGRPDRQLHRRHTLPARPAVGRQPRHRIADAGRAQRRLPGRARSGRPACAAARRRGGGRRVRGRPRRRAGQRQDLAAFKDAVKKAGVKEISHRGERRDDYEGYMMATPEFAVGKHGIGGVQFAELAVDTETGSVKVERIVAVHDCGRPINPKLTESQVIGGVIQGLSYALYEERHLDPASGLQLNANIDQYKIAGAREMPEIEVHLLEQLTGQSSTDARGVAEPANVATAAAIANAFFNATGKRIRTLPMTPANVLAALPA